MQPVGDAQLPVTTVSDMVHQHLQKRRYLASLETDEMDLFRKVRCLRTHPCDRNISTVSISPQVSSVLDGARTKKSKWTTESERLLLCEYWGRMARKAPRSFSFDGFSEKQVKRKLESLRKILPDDLINLSQHIPSEELGETLASFKLLARKQGRAKVARNDLNGTTWEAASSAVLLPDEEARRTTIGAPRQPAMQPLRRGANSTAPRWQLMTDLKSYAPSETVDKLVMAIRALPIQGTVIA